MKKQKELVRLSISQGGFTLIELLVVIAVIGLLASVVLVALNGARLKARDAKRIADLSQISKALELYYNTNNSYPPNGTCDSVLTAAGAPQSTWFACWSTFLSGYVSSMPADPINISAPGIYYFYSYISGYKSIGCAQPIPGGVNNYILTARLENYASSPNGCPGVYSNQSDNGAFNYIIGQ